MPGTLYVVATPLGNLGDLSARASEVLRTVPVVAAEDTRRTRGLLTHLGAAPQLLSYHAHSEDQRLETLLEILHDGRDVALVSDAGTPAVSDPGTRSGRGGARSRHRRRADPGSFRRRDGAFGRGLQGRPVSVPRLRSPQGRRAGPAARPCGRGGMERRASSRRRPGWPDLLADLAKVAGAERRAVVARELTKLHEEFRMRHRWRSSRSYYSETIRRGVS